MQKELLSAYLDGEHQDNQALDALCQDEELQQTWQHYHLVRAVMRNESEVLLGGDFTQKMAMLIESEATIECDQPTPREVESHPFAQTLKKWFAPLTQVAVAASVCLVAVFGVQTYMQNGQESSFAQTPVLQTLPFTNNLQQVSYNAPSKDLPTQDQLEQQSKRINLMLQNHELQRRVNGPALEHVSNHND